MSPPRVRCGICGDFYDPGPQEGDLFKFYPHGEKFYHDHAREAHTFDGEFREIDTNCRGSSPNRMCVWVCSVCGAENYYRPHGRVHGGPSRRSFDRRLGWDYCKGASYPEHKRALGNIDGRPGPVIFYHLGMTFSEQPEQNDPTIKKLLESYEKKPTKKRKNRSSDTQDQSDSNSAVGEQKGIHPRRVQPRAGTNLDQSKPARRSKKADAVS